MRVTCKNIMRQFRINPRAVCRQLLTNLKTHKPLSKSEEAEILLTLKSCNVPNAADRIIADLGRGTLKELLKNI